MEHGGKDCLLLAPNVISLTRIQFPTSTSIVNVSKHLPKASGSICMSVICSPNKYIIHDIADKPDMSVSHDIAGEILIGTINTNNSPSMQDNHNRCDLILQLHLYLGPGWLNELGSWITSQLIQDYHQYGMSLRPAL